MWAANATPRHGQASALPWTMMFLLPEGVREADGRVGVVVDQPLDPPPSVLYLLAPGKREGASTLSCCCEVQLIEEFMIRTW